MKFGTRALLFTGINSALVIWIILAAFVIHGTNSQITGEVNLSPCSALGVCTDYHFKYTANALLQNGILETVTFENFAGDMSDMVISMENVRIQCDFYKEYTVCDADIKTDFSQKCDLFSKCTIKPEDCKKSNMCTTNTYQGLPVCAFGFATEVCLAATLKPTNCFEIRELNVDDCDVHGDLILDVEGVITTIPIHQRHIPISENDLIVNIVHVDEHLPFSDKLTVLNDNALKDFRTIERSNLCIFNNEPDCKAPVRRELDGGDHSIMNAIERIESVEGFHREFAPDYDILFKNRLLADSFEDASTLSAQIGDFVLNSTSSELYFDQHKLAEIDFTFEIFGRRINELSHPCDVVDATVECVGTSLQDIMDCKLKLVIGGTPGSGLLFNWNEVALSIPCKSDIISLPNIMRNEEQLSFCINPINGNKFCSDAETDITHTKPGEGNDDSDHRDDKGAPLEPFDPFGWVKFNKQLQGWMVLSIVIAGIAIALTIPIFCGDYIMMFLKDNGCCMPRKNKNTTPKFELL